MKTTVIQAVKAYLAADEMARQPLPYETALALVKIKQATRADMETFLQEERKLVSRFAATDENGNIEIQGGRFQFRDPREAPSYEAKHRELEETETDIHLPRLMVKPPETIQPAILEALQEFVKFEEGKRP